MDHEPLNNLNPERDDRARRRRARRSEETFSALPSPRDAAEIITAILEEDAHEEILDALGYGRPIDNATARVIAYSLVAHAPETAPTDALLSYFETGSCNYEAVVAEYLPLYADPVMREEGRLLLDWLGTHLFNHEYGADLVADTDPLNGVVAFGTTPDGHRHTIVFAHSGAADEKSTIDLARKLLLLASEHGDGFRAYLRVPGVDALSPTLVDDFYSAHLADPTDKDSNWHRITNRSNLQWTAVAIGGGIYVFVR